MMSFVSAIIECQKATHTRVKARKDGLATKSEKTERGKDDNDASTAVSRSEALVLVDIARPASHI